LGRLLIATGLKCPRPLFEVSRALKELETGEVLEIRADDPAFKLDIEAWCRRTGNQLVELQRDEDVYRAVVRRLV
jgi:tRNA 2-thiouridine synthesizing protein A